MDIDMSMDIEAKTRSSIEAWLRDVEQQGRGSPRSSDMRTAGRQQAVGVSCYR